MSHLLDLGRRPYREVWALQRALHARVAAGEEPDTWIVVEHDPVITLGRNAKLSNVLDAGGIVPGEVLLHGAEDSFGGFTAAAHFAETD